jgi:hypothetical protein
LVTGFLLAGVSGFLGYQVYFRKSKGEWFILLVYQDKKVKNIFFVLN